MQGRFKGEYTYTAEHYVHVPELSVNETLTFAAACRMPNPDTGVRGLFRRTEAECQQRVDSITSLGLGRVSDSKVGNDIIRGISGGERRRVTIAESLLSRACFRCWDNCTRGLDSGTALKFVHYLRPLLGVSRPPRLSACTSHRKTYTTHSTKYWSCIKAGKSMLAWYRMQRTTSKGWDFHALLDYLLAISLPH
jgi:hypothetical protein